MIVKVFDIWKYEFSKIKNFLIFVNKIELKRKSNDIWILYKWNFSIIIKKENFEETFFTIHDFREFYPILTFLWNLSRGKKDECYLWI